jgi:hypothetical protein
MTNLQKIRVDLCCVIVVSNLFARFSNPLYQGDDFSWKTFPSMMEGIVVSYASDSIRASIKKNQIEEVETYAKEAARGIALNLINQAGFI